MSAANPAAAAQRSRTHRIAVTAMLSAAATVLMFLEFPIPFLIPSFVELDFSELPALLAALEGCGTVPEPGTAAAGLVVAADVPSWLEEFLFLLDEVQCEPAVYAMGRRVS